MIIVKKEKSVTMDAICELVAESIRSRSLRPMTLLFKKGVYGTRRCLRGNYIDYRNYQKRQERRIDFAVVD